VLLILFKAKSQKCLEEKEKEKKGSKLCLGWQWLETMLGDKWERIKVKKQGLAPYLYDPPPKKSKKKVSCNMKDEEYKRLRKRLK
jgi:hypothetical protein